MTLSWTIFRLIYDVFRLKLDNIPGNRVKLASLQPLHIVVLPLLIVICYLFVEFNLPRGDGTRTDRVLRSKIVMGQNRLLHR